MRFNKTAKGKSKTVNHEGDKAYKLSPEMNLYSTVCTASLQPKFYEKQDETLERIRELIKKCKPEFVAKLAIYAREKMYLRSVPIVLAVELAKQHNKDSVVSKTTERVIQRADELVEIMAYYQTTQQLDVKVESKKKLAKLSKQISKGVANAFNKFNEYQFGKYNRPSEIKLRDVLFLTHPKPKDKEQEKLFKKIIDDKLEVPYTWEVELSNIGQKHFETEEEKQAAFMSKWEELIDSKKLGYMALLRNLRNILNINVSKKHIINIAKTLSDKENVKKSKQLPFRFLSAYKELQKNDNPLTNMILDALEEAILVSTENIKGYDYDTSVLIACDVSSSMNQSISAKSKIENYDIGLTLGMLLQNKCKSVITGVFGDEWKNVQLPKKSILQNIQELGKLNSEVGWSTNGWKVLEYLIEKKIKVDKIMIFTDCQMWNSDISTNESNDCSELSMFHKLWKDYKKINIEAKMYLFDLSGCGTTPLFVDERDVYLIAGWSDKIFDVLEGIDNGESALNEINKIAF